MVAFADSLNFFTSIGTIVGQALLLAVLVFWLVRYFGAESKHGSSSEKMLIAIGRYGLEIGLLVALVSVAVSLIYSDIIGYEPCKLCWIQRIFLYPQLVILGLAIWKKTKDAAIYCLALSTIGAVIAGYHFYGQSFNAGVLPACDVSGGASCAVRFFVEFGYVTIPLMSFTAFLLIIVFMLLSRLADEARN